MAASSDEQVVLDQLKSTTYYSMRFIPTSEKLEISLSTVRDIVQKSAVRLRGWDLPHYDHNTVSNAQSYVFNTVNWEMHLELWRLYRSGQFVYFSKFWDLAKDFQVRLREQFERGVILANSSQKESVTGIASFVGMIYSVTEMFVFSARLANALKVSDFSLEIVLHNVEGWVIIPGEPSIPWPSFYQSKIGNIRVQQCDSRDIITDPVAAAAKALRDIFECFQWNESERAIQSWQEKFMAGRFAF